MNQPKSVSLSIVIPSYCSEQSIGACLDALMIEREQSEFEIIVVDCSPHDEVAKICQSYGSVRLIRQLKRFNPGVGRNIGAAQANGDYLAFIDADVVMSRGAIMQIKRRAKQGYRIFGGALELAPVSETEHTIAPFVEHYYFNHESQASRPSSQRANLSSAMMVIKRDLFELVGGFSDIARMQDTELTERLVKQGFSLFFFPEIVAHQTQDSHLKKVLRKIFITGNNLYFIRYEQYPAALTYLVMLLLPILMLVKVTRINLRNMRYAGSWFMLIKLCPFMYVCGCAWMLGFYRAFFFNGGIAAGR